MQRKTVQETVGIPDKWLVGGRAIEAPHTTLVCFPPAGGGATTFSSWRRLVSAGVELLAVELPGRESRSQEPPLTSSAEAAQSLTPLIVARAAPSIVLFGHSLGALLAFDVARRMAGPGLRAPALLVVSGSRAPHRPSRLAGITDRSDAGLVSELRRFGCDPAEALSNPEVAEMFMTPLRADLRMVSEYDTAGFDGTVLDVPILALSGRSDLVCDYDDAEAWATYTSARFTHKSFDGGHFFIRERAAQVVTAVMTEMADLARAADGGWC